MSNCEPHAGRPMRSDASHVIYGEEAAVQHTVALDLALPPVGVVRVDDSDHLAARNLQLLGAPRLKVEVHVHLRLHTHNKQTYTRSLAHFWHKYK